MSIPMSTAMSTAMGMSMVRDTPTNMGTPNTPMSMFTRRWFISTSMNISIRMSIFMNILMSITMPVMHMYMTMSIPGSMAAMSTNTRLMNTRNMTTPIK
jgi:hypothetical protein